MCPRGDLQVSSTDFTNPPFGGKERAEVQQNFPIKTSETAFLFLQHFIKILKTGGHAGIVIKNTFLSNTDNASVSIRKLLLESANLHTVLDLPAGTFTGAGVKTVILFFEKGAPTQKVWFYQLNLGRNLGKTNSLNENDLAEFVRLQKTKAYSENSWSMNVADINKNSYDLSVKNPYKKDEFEAACLFQSTNVYFERKIKLVCPLMYMKIDKCRGPLLSNCCQNRGDGSGPILILSDII